MSFERLEMIQNILLWYDVCGGKMLSFRRLFIGTLVLKDLDAARLTDALGVSAVMAIHPGSS